MVSTDMEERADLVIQMEQILINDCAVLVHGYYNSTFLSNAAKVSGADIHTVDYYCGTDRHQFSDFSIDLSGTW